MRGPWRRRTAGAEGNAEELLQTEGSQAVARILASDAGAGRDAGISSQRLGDCAVDVGVDCKMCTVAVKYLEMRKTEYALQRENILFHEQLACL